MGHRRAKLTPLGRAVVVERVLVEGWPAARVAEAASVSRATVYKWVRRFLEEGTAGLQDRTSAPQRCPHALTHQQVNRIIQTRNRTGWGPHRLGPWLGHPRSTVYGVLRRHGVPRLADLDRPTRIPIRYERQRPGELLHVDVKKLGKIPPGGGHRVHGRRYRPVRLRGLGYDYLHVAVDDYTRLSYVEALGDERGETSAGFLSRAARHFDALGVHVEAVMTDNANSYVRSTAVAEVLHSLGARHLTTPPYHPQVNGKAERFNRTMLEEWAYVRLYRSNGARLAALPRWLAFYNQRRPHTALGGRPPITRVSTT